jgi:hypothetical protein|nr:MAG TPA: hypothetical protein [Caudoviricetes sp.]
MLRYKVGDKFFVNKHIATYTRIIKECEKVEIVEVDVADMNLTYNIENSNGYCIWVNEICFLDLIGIKV